MTKEAKHTNMWT